jgi:Putative peptidoglycan binding domain
MEGRETRDPGYDDWFDEPEPPTEGTGRPGRRVYDAPEDAWVLPEERQRPRRGGGRREFDFGGRTLTATQVAIVAVSALAILLAILAAAGVFNSGGKTSAPPVTTSTLPRTTSHSTSTPTTTKTAVTAPTQALRPGDTGSQVKLLQQALAALGFSPGKIDSNYGPATTTAVKQFQASKGLTQDGLFGPKTAAALQQALSG